jgi:hypothetical protein
VTPLFSIVRVRQRGAIGVVYRRAQRFGKRVGGAQMTIAHVDRDDSVTGALVGWVHHGSLCQIAVAPA